MSDHVMQLDSKTFAAAVAQGVTLVDFWAPWCGPCRMQGPILEKVAAKIGAKAQIGKVDVDASGDVAMQFGVQSIPTLVLLKNGQEVQRFVGVQPEATLVSAIEGAV